MEEDFFGDFGFLDEADYEMITFYYRKHIYYNLGLRSPKIIIWCGMNIPEPQLT